MKIKVLFFAVILTMLAVNSAPASEINPSAVLKMQNAIYGSAIDTKVAFYQKRVYLTDSEYKILADIGREAADKINYLKLNRPKLIEKMIDAKVQMNQQSIACFIGKEIHSSNALKFFSAAR